MKAKYTKNMGVKYCFYRSLTFPKFSRNVQNPSPNILHKSSGQNLILAAVLYIC